MDLAQELGLSYSTQGTWVDLYLNGEYRGIYLLAESVTVGGGRVDINDIEKHNKQKNASIEAGTARRYDEGDNKGFLLENGSETDGGYLIEKDHPKHWEAEESGFCLSRGDLFTINAPQHASKEQVANMLRHLLNIPADHMPKLLDATDALAAALTHFYETSKPQVEKGPKSWEQFLAKHPERLAPRRKSE